MEKNFKVTLTLIGQCPMSNSCEIFLTYLTYTTICSSFKWIEPLFLYYRVHRQTHTKQTQTDRQTNRYTDGHKYSIVAVDKPKL